jgi:hypothetical protein
VNKRLFDTHYKSIISYDLETQAWLGGESVDLDVINFRKYLKHYRRLDYYRYVPYYVCVAMSEKLIHTILDCKNCLDISKASEFYTNVVYPSIEIIEKNCMYVELDSFNSNFNRKYSNNFVKVLYNIHTKTGRPSNVYDGVNYSAINKKDDRETELLKLENDELKKQIEILKDIQMKCKRQQKDYERCNKHNMLPYQYIKFKEDELLDAIKEKFKSSSKKPNDKTIIEFIFQYFEKNNKVMNLYIIEKYMGDIYDVMKIFNKKYNIDNIDIKQFYRLLAAISIYAKFNDKIKKIFIK